MDSFASAHGLIFLRPKAVRSDDHMDWCEERTAPCVRTCPTESPFSDHHKLGPNWHTQAFAQIPAAFAAMSLLFVCGNTTAHHVNTLDAAAILCEVMANYSICHCLKAAQHAYPLPK